MSAKWLALAREAGLASEHIAIGVAALGKADYARHPYYSQAFFALSVGIERSGKLGLVVDHALQHNGAFPSDQVVRSFGHDLQRLLHKLDEVAERLGLSGSWNRLPDTVIHRGIVIALSDFARNITRYYNLDLVTDASTVRSVADPVAAWFENVTLPVLAAHDNDKRRQVRERKAIALGELAGPSMMVRFHSESGEPISSVHEAAFLSLTTRFARPYERMYVLQIARFIAGVLEELGDAALRAGLEDVPYFGEIFGHFRNDDAYFKRRKTWSRLE